MNNQHLNAKSRRWKRPTGALDKRNEALAKFEVTLHPTKGFRRFSAKRTIAAQIVYMLKTGQGRGMTVRDQAVMLNSEHV